MTRYDLHCSFICSAIYCVLSDSGRFISNSLILKFFFGHFLCLLQDSQLKPELLIEMKTKNKTAATGAAVFLFSFSF